MQPFSFDASGFRPSRVDVGGEAFGGYAFVGSSAGVVNARIVAAGIGRPEDYPTLGLGGAVAVVQRGDLQFKEKAVNAAGAGASALLIYNNAPGGLSARVDPATIPIVGLSQDDGKRLLDILTANPATTATVTVPAATSTGYNVIARHKGATDCTSVTGGHYDSVPVTGGADDNASGTAEVLETARVAAARQLPGDNCFVAFSGEEFGLFGSRSFLEQLPRDAVSKIRFMLNLDVVGTASDLGLIGDADTVEVARVQAQKLGVQARPSELPMNAGSDHLSFRDAGVPVVMMSVEDNVIHTSQDALGRIQQQRLDDVARLAYATLAALAGS